MSQEIWSLGVDDTATAIRKKQYTCYEVVEASVSRLHKTNPKINAVTVDLSEKALEQSRKLDSQLSDGDNMEPLLGVPITLKENIDLKGEATTLAVEKFTNNLAPSDSPVVNSLKKAGAIIIGKTNMPEFGLRWFTENPMRGGTKNPWDETRTPGGSSGGAAAAVAMGIGAMAHGNDIGGSLRYPSYCCGVVTIKPGFGRVPNYNPSFGAKRPMGFQIMAAQGPITRSVADARLAFEVMAQPSVLDPWSVPKTKTDGYNKDQLRIAVPNFLGNNVDPSVSGAIEKAAGILSSKGHLIETIDLPSVDELVDLWGTILFNDIRVFQLDLIRESGSKDIVSIIDSKMSNLSKSSLEDYIMALARRVEAIQEWAIIMEKFPIILAPVSLQPPLEPNGDIGGKDQYKKMEDFQRWLIMANFLGLPSVSLPTGTADGLPTGVQLIGRRFYEEQCLDIAQDVEDEVGLLVNELWNK